MGTRAICQVAVAFLIQMMKEGMTLAGIKEVQVMERILEVELKPSDCCCPVAFTGEMITIGKEGEPCEWTNTDREIDAALTHHRKCQFCNHHPIHNRGNICDWQQIGTRGYWS